MTCVFIIVLQLYFKIEVLSRERSTVGRIHWLANMYHSRRYVCGIGCLIRSSFTAFLSALQHEPGGSARIRIGFCGSRMIRPKIPWSRRYSSAKTLIDKIIWTKVDYTTMTTMLNTIAIYCILKANSFAKMGLSHSKNTGTDILLSVIGTSIFSKNRWYWKPTHHRYCLSIELKQSAHA